jgi:hypothetical protein
MATEPESSAKPISVRHPFNTVLNVINTCCLLGIFVLLIVLVHDFRNLTADQFSNSTPRREGPVFTVDVRSVYDVVTNVITGTPTVEATFGSRTPVVSVTQSFGDVLTVTATR